MWTTKVKWQPCWPTDSGLQTSTYGTHLEAYTAGRQVSCCRGALHVEVTAPDGTKAHEWSKDDNVWRAYVERPK